MRWFGLLRRSRLFFLRRVSHRLTLLQNRAVEDHRVDHRFRNVLRIRSTDQTIGGEGGGEGAFGEGGGVFGRLGGNDAFLGVDRDLERIAADFGCAFGGEDERFVDSTDIDNLLLICNGKASGDAQRT